MLRLFIETTPDVRSNQSATPPERHSPVGAWSRSTNPGTRTVWERLGLIRELPPPLVQRRILQRAERAVAGIREVEICACPISI
jgi:hypothetical protein